MTAALTFFGIASTEEVPTKNIILPHITCQSEENKRTNFEDVFGKFINNYYLLQNNASTNREEDYVQTMCPVLHLPHYALFCS